MSHAPFGLYTATPAELKERLAAERTGAPFVVYRDDDGRQRLVGLGDDVDRVTIGRQAAGDIVLDWDQEVSRVHAELQRVGTEWTLVDDGSSRNGSFLNGERVRGRRRLRDGDVIKVGRTHFSFRMPQAGDSAETAQPANAAMPLSDAQRRVLVALCRPFARTAFAAPLSNAEIAAELVLSAETVKSHLRALFGAFGLEHLPQHQKRVRLAQLALERGVVTVEDLHPPRPPSG